MSDFLGLARISEFSVCFSARLSGMYQVNASPNREIMLDYEVGIPFAAIAARLQ